MSISHVMMTTQLKPPAMPWKPEDDITPECANEIWSGIESVEPFCARQQSPCSVLKASVVCQSFGAISSLIGLRGYRHTGTFDTRCGSLPTCRQPKRHMWNTPGVEPGFREDTCYRQIFLEGWAECAAVRKSTHIGAQQNLHDIFQVLKLHISMPHAPKEMQIAQICQQSQRRPIALPSFH